MSLAGDDVEVPDFPAELLQAPPEDEDIEEDEEEVVSDVANPEAGLHMAECDCDECEWIDVGEDDHDDDRDERWGAPPGLLESDADELLGETDGDECPDCGRTSGHALGCGRAARAGGSAVTLFARPPAREGSYAERRCASCGKGPVRWTYVPPLASRPRGPGIHGCEACGHEVYGWPWRSVYPRQRVVVRRR